MPVDPTGVLAGGGPEVGGPADLRAALAARPEQFAQALTEKLMTFALGRAVEYHDMPTVRRIVRQAAEDDFRFESIVRGIVHSPAFRMRTVPEADTGDGEVVALHAPRPGAGPAGAE